MWVLFLISLGFVFPAVAVKSIRAKTIYFINAFLVTWALTNILLPYVRSNYTMGIGTTQILLLLFLMILGVLYFIYGVVKFIMRFRYFEGILDKKPSFNFQEMFIGPLNDEEKRALLFAWPGMLIILYYVIGLLYKL